VNFKRAEADVLREMLDGLLTQSELANLVSFRDGSPDCALAEALAQLRLEKDRAERARSAMTDTSSCHSVWVVAQGATRRWYRFCVSEGDEPGKKPVRREFPW